MLTDDEIDDHSARLHNEVDPRDAPTHRRIDDLIAQAREANALRVENAALRERLSLAMEDRPHAGDPDWSKR